MQDILIRDKNNKEEKNPPKKFNIVLLSGGMDSTTCLAEASTWDGQLCALHVNYGQLTEDRELRAYHEICDHYEIPNEYRCIVALPVLTITNSALVGNADLDMTGEAVDDQTIVPLSYVPFRNAHILAAAVSWGESLHTFTGQRPDCYIELNIVHGAVEEDAAGYPDCREEFYNLFTKTANVGTREETIINFHTPVIRMTKPEIIMWAWRLNAPLQLTWSCYSSGDSEETACGLCDSCLLRTGAFKIVNIIDPVPYATVIEWNAAIIYAPIPEPEEGEE